MVFMLINKLQSPVQNDSEAHPTPYTAMVKHNFSMHFHEMMLRHGGHFSYTHLKNIHGKCNVLVGNIRNDSVFILLYV